MEIVERIDESQLSKDEESEEEVVAAEVILEIPRIFVVSDCYFCYNGKRQILPKVQRGIMPGHYLKIDKKKKNGSFVVSANASISDPKSIFKITNVAVFQNNNSIPSNVEIIESVAYPTMVIAIDKADNVFVKKISRSPDKFSSLKDAPSEILLVRNDLPGSNKGYFTYSLYNSSGQSSRFLGFGSDGKPLVPSSLNATQDEAKFRDFPVS